MNEKECYLKDMKKIALLVLVQLWWVLAFNYLTQSDTSNGKFSDICSVKKEGIGIARNFILWK